MLLKLLRILTVLILLSGIITKVNSDSIEVIPQNVLGSPTSSHQLKKQNGNYTVGNQKHPTGWLRLP